MKKIIYGILAVTIAISGSAFKNAQRHYFTTNFYGQNPDGSGYFLLTDPYNASLCDASTTKPCAWELTATGQGHVPNTFTYSQAVAYEGNGWIIQASTYTGIYYGN